MLVTQVFYFDPQLFSYLIGIGNVNHVTRSDLIMTLIAFLGRKFLNLFEITEVPKNQKLLKNDLSSYQA